MEFPNQAVVLERVLAAVALISLLMVGFIESGSPLAVALRQGKPWVDYSEGNFSIYQPLGPSMALIAVNVKDEGEISSLFSRLQPSFGAQLNFFDRFLRRLAVARLKPDQIERVQLPKISSAREELIGKLLYPRKLSSSRLVTAEILNASGVAGLASKAAKVLRSNSVDVVALGNWSEQASHTVIYDRTGNPEAARFVRRALGCSGAEAETAVDEKRFVDTTVILAGDCLSEPDHLSGESLAQLWRRIFFKS